MMSPVRRYPIPGEIIEKKIETACLGEICRVLYVNEGLDRIVVIPVTPRRSKKRLYFIGPVVVNLEKLMGEINQQWLAINKAGIKARPDAAATDEDLDKKYLRRGQEISNPLRARKARYEIIRPLVEDKEDSKLLFDPEIFSERVAARAKEVNDGKQTMVRTERMIKELLYQYWAGNSVPGALTPFSGAKGGRGKVRIQENKLGRRNALTTETEKENEGFIMREVDKDNCGFGWRNYYVRRSTIKKALRRTWREFYSVLETDENGVIHKRLLPAGKRPTCPQFVRWGLERSPGHESWKKQLTKFNLGRLDRALFGTSSDNVVAVGQRGSTDSTSPDIEFVRVENRLERIGPAHRILVVDSLYDYIPGFYLGLDAPSAATVQLAFLHALTDLTEWLEWLGLADIDPDDWIRIRFAHALADNTDARCEGAIEALDRVGTGLKFVGVARSDLNSPSETRHHVLHRMVDHNLHGTTHGQRHERGEERADILARHTIIEAIRETARAIHTHNTMELNIRPTLEMQRELVDKGIKLTRLNLTRWKINQGKVAQNLIGIEEARINLMPLTRGTFTQFGVKLLRPDTGQKREFIERIKYVSKHPVIMERIMKAKVGRRGMPAEYFDDDFLHDPYKPTEIFYRNPIDGELIRLESVSKDEDMPFECSLPDIINLMKGDAIRLFNARNTKEEALSDMEAGQEETKRDAKDAYDDALAAVDKPPSTSAIHRNKKANREKEKATYQYGMPIQSPPFVEEQNTEWREEEIAPERPPSNDASNETQQDSPSANAKTTPDGDDKPTHENHPSVPISILQQAILNRRQEGNKRGH